MKHSKQKFYKTLVTRIKVRPHFAQEAKEAAEACPGDRLGEGPVGGAEAQVRRAGEGSGASGRRLGGRKALARVPALWAEGEESETAQSPVQAADQRKPLVLHLICTNVFISVNPRIHKPFQPSSSKS